MNLFAAFMFLLVLVRLIFDIVRWARGEKMRNPRALIFVGIILLAVVIPLFTRPGEHPEFELEVTEMSYVALYQAESGTIINERIELLGQATDEAALRTLQMILSGCERHRRDHPGYTTYYILEIAYEGKIFPYALRVDSDGGIDVSPYEEDGQTIYSLGVYRCPGLDAFVEELMAVANN